MPHECKLAKQLTMFIIFHQPYCFVFLFIYTSFVLLDNTGDLTQQYLADARIYIKKNGVSGIEKFLKEKLKESRNFQIRFAITGDSGAGKSAFINAIRG